MQRKLTALLAATLALALAAVAFVGCGPSSTPTDSVNKAVAALKAKDLDTLAKYYSGDLSSLKDPQAALQSVGGESLGVNASAENLTDEQKATVEELEAKILDFDCSVANEKIDGNKATVDATITTYDFGTMLKDSLSDYFTQALTAAFSGAGTDQQAYVDMLYDILKGKMATLTEKTQTATVSIPLTKGEDGTWTIDDISKNEEVSDALSGGVISTLKSSLESLGNSLSFDGLGSLGNGAQSDDAAAGDGAATSEATTSDGAASSEAAASKAAA